MRRALVIYHSFDEWEMGPIRLRRIVRHLPAAGYKPVVLTSERTQRSTADVPASLECLRAGGIDLAELYRKARRSHGTGSGGAPANRDNRLTSLINRWFMIPDKQITWKRAAIAAARRYLRENQVDVLFASLAPRTNLLVAAQLARKLDLPCVMEFRDLWTGSPYYHLAQPTALHRLVHRRLERRVIASATRVSAVCQGIADYLSTTYASQLPAPVALNYNFYDPAEYPDHSIVPRPRPMIISYIGAMYASRSPMSFFDGLKQFINEQQITPNDVRFRWAGSVIGVAGIDEAIRERGLEPYIDRLGQMTHEQALRELCSSDVSLLIQAPGDAIHIPGKLFEAMGASVPVLAIADEGEIRDIVCDVNAGLVCPHTATGIATGLRDFWRRHQNGELWSFNETNRLRYRAIEATTKLAALFDEAIAAHGRTT